MSRIAVLKNVSAMHTPFLNASRLFSTTRYSLTDSNTVETHSHSHAPEQAPVESEQLQEVDEFMVFPDIRDILPTDLVGSKVFNSKQYFIERSATGNLPIYSEYKKAGHVAYTEIRKIHGNVLQFRKELQNAVPSIDPDSFSIRQQANKLIIKGNHTDLLKKLLSTKF
ncbi:hypothetical protein TPHA_0H02300 [Tetrapisispora phaffii CBS 4417]|uniref:Large ribosomal subunit protein mL49 n=1 Tax=Tetrapisispora phaffii (strain ATCC 24235 / CBS 4417 / NBRC 1672 / NRRL Y-8282 / UCD 70-5) TaxID=1071381 RepID=G8BWI3_TETPH|nr:mitochondrial 54S ribosomal protein IMG2 TPHA_0H02300 [Tetrapisispora phaffii CBS 4417]CCE64434.1 hypothetical protein TPHA_0H02300 [Tetrapisispora phaffii CBS 4417]